MLIAHSMPAVNNVALSGGAGAAWLTADGSAALFDGRPARKARLQWRNDATPALAHTVTLTLSLAASTTLRVIALLGLSLPAGVLVHVRGAAGAALGGNTQTQRTVRFADGSVGVWFVTAGTHSGTSLEIVIHNDRDGATWATSATTVDIGEVVAMPALEVPAMLDMGDALEDSSLIGATLALQPAVVRRAARRRLSMSVNLTNAAGTYTAADSLAVIRNALRGASRAAIIPMLRQPQQGVGAPFDYALINAQAVYGYGQVGAIGYVPGSVGQWTMPLEFVEVPAAQ